MQGGSNMKKTSFRKKTYEEIIESKKKAQAKQRVKPKVKKKKPKTLTWYKKKLDAQFSKFIRYRDKGQCFTCPMKEHPKKMQNGHFAPRQYLSLRYDEKNCNCQCYACNMLYGGQPSKYAVELERKYGRGIVEELEGRRKEITKLDIAWYVEKIEYYKNITKEYG